MGTISFKISDNRLITPYKCHDDVRLTAVVQIGHRHKYCLRNSMYARYRKNICHTKYSASK